MASTLVSISDTHKEVDEIMRKQHEFVASRYSKTLSCKKGCFACCHQAVASTSFEAAYIASKIKHEKIKYDEKQLEDQVSITTVKKEGVSFDSKATLEKRRCAFLKDGICGIYEFRPIACRTYHMYSDPKYCVEPKNDGNRVFANNELVKKVRIKIEGLGGNLNGAFNLLVYNFLRGANENDGHRKDSQVNSNVRK